MALTEEEKKQRKKDYEKKYYEKKLKEKKKKYYEENKEKIKEKKKKYLNENKEKIKERSKKYYGDNKEKIKDSSNKYYGDNKEKVKKRNKKYYEENKEKVKKRSKKYYGDNKEKVKEKTKEYRNKKYQTDELFRLRKNIRALICNPFKNNGYTKKSRTHEILGCSYEDFKIYLESKFESWMNWDNKGNPKDGILEPNKTWDIDHIIPLASAKTEEEVIKLNHYTNLRPLCSYVNRNIKKHHLEEDLKKDLVGNL